jgi:hypothetical protein
MCVFEAKEPANAFAAFKNTELKRNGVEHAEFPTELRVVAQECADKLKRFGRTIEDATKHFIGYLEATEKSCMAVQLVKAVVAAKKRDGASVRHVSDLRSRLNIFAKQLSLRTHNESLSVAALCVTIR